MAKISVVIPVYNVAAYIEKCMETVVNQTMQDLEIIIVNDGTKDNSMELCERFIQNDSRIVVVNKENGGLMSAWMAGVQVATSEYIGFVDSDDWIDLDYFEKLYEKILLHEADVVVGQFVYEYPTPYVMKRSKEQSYTGREEVMKLMDGYLLGFTFEEPPISYCRWDKLYKRQLILDNMAFFNQKISLGEDVNTNTAVLPDCKKIVVLNDMPKYHYRVNQSSIVNTYKENTIDGICELHDTLTAIAEKKGLSLHCVKSFIGNMVFEEITKAIELRGASFGKRCDIMRNVLRKCPKGALSAYADVRQSGFIRMYCAMLEHGFFASCIVIRQTRRFMR